MMTAAHVLLFIEAAVIVTVVPPTPHDAAIGVEPCAVAIHKGALLYAAFNGMVQLVEFDMTQNPAKLFAFDWSR